MNECNDLRARARELLDAADRSLKLVSAGTNAELSRLVPKMAEAVGQLEATRGVA